MISEAKIIHKLWNVLEERGYRVAGDVKVVPEEIHQALRKDILTIDENYKIVIKKKGAPTTIDLVATDGRKFTGFVVNDSFAPFEQGRVFEQLDAYTYGGMLDEIYVVIPEDIAKRVLSSYAHVIKGCAGLMVVDKDYRFHELKDFPSHPLQRLNQPELKENEALLKQVLWNHFESEFNVECEGILPKPEVFKHSIFRKTSNPYSFLQKIDLFLLPKGYSITEVAYKKLDSIGVEIKYEIKSEKALKNIVKQLNRYADSRGLTRLYLATSKINEQLIEKIERMDRKFGLLLWNGKEVETVIDAPRLEMLYDIFVYMPPSGEKVKIYEIGKPKSVKDLDFPYYHYTNTRI